MSNKDNVPAKKIEDVIDAAFNMNVKFPDVPVLTHEESEVAIYVVNSILSKHMKKYLCSEAIAEIASSFIIPTMVVESGRDKSLFEQYLDAIAAGYLIGLQCGTNATKEDIEEANSLLNKSVDYTAKMVNFKSDLEDLNGGK